jgi:hypothetical protein
MRLVTPVAAGKTVGQYAAADRFHLGPHPARVIHALAHRDRTGRLHGGGKARDCKWQDKRDVHRPAHMRKMRNSEHRRIGHRGERLRIEQAGEAGSDITHHQPDQCADHPSDVGAPDIESSHAAERQRSDQPFHAAHRGRSRTKHGAQAGKSRGDPDHEDDEAGDFSRKYCAQSIQEWRDDGLDRPGEHRHAIGERKASQLRGKQRWRQIDRRECCRAHIA